MKMDISLIIPVYGAESFLRKNLEMIDRYISRQGESWELILVIDASPDRSGEICREFARTAHSYPVKVLTNDFNLGKGASVKRGMLEACGKYRIFTDCDLAYPMTETHKIIKTLRNGADLAIASRVHEQSLYTISPNDFHYLYTRHLASRAFNFLVRKILFPSCFDSQAGLKGFTAESAIFLFSELRLAGFSFDMELLYLAHRSSLRIEEVPIHFLYQQEPSTIAFYTDGLRTLRDICCIRYWSLRGKYSFRMSRGRPRKLIVNADDFGLSKEVNEGVLSAIKGGFVSSASILVNFPDSDEAFRLAREHSLDIGWHVNLTEGKPVTPPHSIPTLVDRNGEFFRLKEFLIRLLWKKIDLGDIIAELNSQWALFEKAGLIPSHVDGHEHIHVMPLVREAVRDQILARKIPFLRLPRERDGLRGSRLLARWFLRLLKGCHEKFWKNSRARILPFSGISLLPHAGNLLSWQELFASLKSEITEIMVHPGLSNTGPFPGDRRAEYDLLAHPEWKSLLKGMGFQLANFQEMIPDSNFEERSQHRQR